MMERGGETRFGRVLEIVVIKPSKKRQDEKVEIIFFSRCMGRRNAHPSEG